MLPYRSNIPKLAEFTFDRRRRDLPATRARAPGRHAVTSSSAARTTARAPRREHAAIAPRYLGLRVVIAKSFARIHWQNLVNFGVLPLEFVDEADYDEIETGDVLSISGIRGSIGSSDRLTIRNTTRDSDYDVRHRLSPRQVEVLLAGGLIPWLHERRDAD